MNISPSFIKGNIALLHTRLATLGFKKRKAEISTIQVADDVLGWIGLNKATRGLKGFLEINPVVGVRNQRIEEIVAELVGEKPDDVIPPTLAGNIGYLMPADKYRPYIFSEDGPVETTVDELVKDVREYALPFIRRHIDMVTLVNGMKTRRFAAQFMVAYRIPVGLFLLGQKDEAGLFLKAELAKIENTRDAAALRFKKFATNLANRIQNE